MQLVERKVRSRAQQIYEARGQDDGKDLQDWFQAESEILENNVLGPIYRRFRSGTEVSKSTTLDPRQDPAYAERV